jgi:maltokinase
MPSSPLGSPLPEPRTKPEATLTFNLDLLTSARWFAGKGRALRDALVAERLEPPGADGAAVELVDVTFADGDVERYALPVRDGAECTGADPLWPALARAAGLGAAVDELVLNQHKLEGRHLAEDLSNTVVVLGERVVLKLYRRPEPGPHPEAELLAALDGSPHAPRLLGALEQDGVTLLVAQSLVDGEQVGWEAIIARLAAGDPVAGEPAELARVTATLHRMLRERLGAATGPASSLLPGRHETAAGLLAGELALLAPRVERGLEPLRRRAAVPVQRVHGDLHVAQFLRTRGGLVVVDWEGEPGLALAERARPRPALRDLASLRLSLAHAARAAHRRNEGFDWVAWSTDARSQALDAYAAVAGPVDAGLLHALELEKELAELAYAERWLPEWLYAPRAVLPFVLEEAG